MHFQKAKGTGLDKSSGEDSHRSKNPLDALLDRTSYTRETPQQRKQRQRREQEQQTRTYLAAKELNPEIRGQLLADCENHESPRDHITRKRNRFAQSQALQTLVEVEKRSRLDRGDYVRRLADELSNPFDNGGETRLSTPQTRMGTTGEKSLQEKLRYKAFEEDHQRMNASSRCAFCIESDLCQKLRNTLFVSHSSKCYLASMTRRDLLIPFHSTLCPLEHVQSSVLLDDESLEEIRNFKKCLRSLFLKSHDKLQPVMQSVGYGHGPYKVVFIEWNLPSPNTYGGAQEWKQLSVNDMGKGAHFSIDVLPLSEQDYEEAKMIVAQEFTSMGGDINRTNRSLRKVEPSPKRGPKDLIPKSTIPYIYVDFGLSQGFLHTLEDSSLKGNLRDRVDRRVIRSLMESFYPESLNLLAMDWGNYIQTYRRVFAAYDWNVSDASKDL